MSPLQKLLAGLLAGLVLGLVVVLAGVGYVRGGGKTALRATNAPTAGSTIPTLDGKEDKDQGDLVEDTTTTSSTTTTTTIPLDTTTSTPPTTRPGPPLSGSGAVLSTPGAAITRSLASGANCNALADAGATEVRCELFRARGGDLIWLTEITREGVLGSAMSRRVYVFQRAGSGQWTTVLEKVDAGAAQFREVNVRVTDVSGDGSQDVVFGFRSAGSNSLAVDVVEGPGVVAAHRDLAGGSARVSTGQLDVWSDTGATATHEVIRVVQGAYRVVSSEQVSSGEVPPSQL